MDAARRALACGYRLEWLCEHPGARLLWYSPGANQRVHVAVFSSRLTRDLERWGAWFAYLRTLIARLDPAREQPLAVRGTTAEPWIVHGAKGMGRPYLDVTLPRDRREALASWLVERLQHAEADVASASAHSCFVSPSVSSSSDSAETFVTACPAQDAIQAAMARKAFVLRVRRGGNVERLVDTMLAEAWLPPGAIRVAWDPSLIPEDVLRRWLDRGAVAWHLKSHQPRARKTSRKGTETLSPSAADVLESTLDGRAMVRGIHSGNWAEVLGFGTSGETDLLTHCTRRRHGPWPHQAESRYRQGYVFEEPSRHRGPIDVLRRILRTHRLIGQARAIRGGHRVVCFTALELPRLRHMRVYRPHRGQWDFSGYGIVIRGKCLRAWGAKPVIYGGPSDWEQIDPCERWRFQRASSQTKSGHTYDWTAEQEWRVLGNLDLTRLASEDAWLLVPTREEAVTLVGLSRWPILYWDSDDS